MLHERLTGAAALRALIIGANGLIGRQLARLLAEAEVGSLILADRLPAAPPAGARIPVECRLGDFCDRDFARDLLQGVDCVFHLAALLATESEADLRRGMSGNVAGLRQLLMLCEELPRPPKLLYASSVAAFGGPLPETVDDDVARTPQTSYGTHKAIAELLIDDYTRRGLVDGRVLRLPIVLVRNGPPSGAVSDRVAALIREPVMGKDVTCGLRPETRMSVTSAHHAATAFQRLASVDAAAFRHTRAMNLPSLSVTAAELAEAAGRAPVQARGRIAWVPDPSLQAVVDGWPRRFASAHADALGLGSGDTVDDIIARFIAETGLR